MATFNRFPKQALVFTCLQYKSFENTVGKGAIMSNFSFSHDVFYLFLRIHCHFHQILSCRLQTLSVWKSRKSVIWERVKRKDPLQNKT